MCAEAHSAQPRFEETDRPTDRATAVRSMQLNTDNGGGGVGRGGFARPCVRPSGVYVTQSTHSVFQSLQSAVFACPGAIEGRWQLPRPPGDRPVCAERARSRSVAWLLPPAGVSANPMSPRVIERARPPAQAEDERK